MPVSEVCNREVVIVDSAESVAEAMRLLRAFHVGDLVVIEQRGLKRMPVGIVTDRDMVIEVAAQGVDPEAVTVGDVMSTELVTVVDETDLFDAVRTMRNRGVRRLPVVDRDGGLVGMLTVDDMIDLLAEALSGLAGLIVREQQQERRLHP